MNDWENKFVTKVYRWVVGMLSEFGGDNKLTEIQSSNLERQVNQLVNAVLYEAGKLPVSQSNHQLLDQIIELIKSNEPDLVCPIDTPPFREDYINKHKLISKIQKLKESHV